jgi:uncharacterized membrane protein YbhN (UPF0104 family)
MAETEGGDRGLGAAFALPYLVALIALLALVKTGGVWDLLGNSRLLDVLHRGGVVAVTDADQGLVAGVPSLDHYVAATDPIDWELVVAAAGLFALSWLVRGVQFLGIARTLGIDGAPGHMVRARLYGLGIDRVLPYGSGRVAAASALEGHGAAPDRAAQAVFTASLLVIAEVALLAVYGLFAVGLGMWARQLFWAVAILVVAWLMVRRRGAEGRAARRRTRLAARATFALLARRPAVLARLVVLGVGAILLFDLGAYAVAQAFTSTHVILNVEGDILLMAVVAGYVARLVPFTPGGLGQWEWAFTAALYASGLGLAEAMTLAILVALVRYAAGAVTFGVMQLSAGGETSVGRVLAALREPVPTGGQRS